MIPLDGMRCMHDRGPVSTICVKSMLVSTICVKSVLVTAVVVSVSGNGFCHESFTECFMMMRPLSWVGGPTRAVIHYVSLRD